MIKIMQDKLNKQRDIIIKGLGLSEEDRSPFITNVLNENTPSMPQIEPEHVN